MSSRVADAASDQTADAEPGLAAAARADEKRAPLRSTSPGRSNPPWTEDQYRAVFAAWPLEWIGTEADRVAILGAMIDWTLIPVELQSLDVD